MGVTVMGQVSSYCASRLIPAQLTVLVLEDVIPISLEFLLKISIDHALLHPLECPQILVIMSPSDVIGDVAIAALAHQLHVVARSPRTRTVFLHFIPATMLDSREVTNCLMKIYVPWSLHISGRVIFTHVSRSGQQPVDRKVRIQTDANEDKAKPALWDPVVCGIDGVEPDSISRIA